jgi:amino acid transporter
MATTEAEFPPGPGLESEVIAERILPKVLNTFDMVAIFIAVVLFITNAPGFFGSGPVALTYLVLGFVTFLIPGAIVTGQLGKLFPGEGSIYLWTYKAFGAFTSFLAGFAAWWPGILVMMATGTAVTSLLMTLLNTTLQPWVQGVIVLAVIVLSGVVASLRFRVTQNMVNTVFVLYVIGMAIVVLAAIVWLLQGHSSYAEFSKGWFNGMGTNPFDFNNPAQTWSLYGFIILALLGIEVPLNMGVEVADSRAVTRYLLWGGAIVMIAYLSVTWALEVAGAPSQAGNIGVLILVPEKVLGLAFGWIVGLIIIGFFVFITVVYNFAFARLLFVSGLDRRLPPAVSKLNANKAPYVAIIVQTVLASIFAIGVYLVYPYAVGGGNAADLANRAYLLFQAAVTVIWLLSMAFLFLDVLVIISKYSSAFEERKIAHPLVFWIASVVGIVATIWGAVVTFTSPWAANLFSKGDWALGTAVIVVVSLLAVPVIWYLGRAAARGDKLPVESQQPELVES